MSKLRDYLFPLKQGARIYPEDLAGMIGQPVVGNVWYVDADGGSDSNKGDELSRAFASFEQAVAQASTNSYDVIVVAPTGTSGTGDTTGIDITQNHLTVVGGAAPTKISQRARITWGTDSVDPCLTVSGAGVRLLNVQLATFQASNDVLVNVTGSRMYAHNVHFAGIGHATAGDDATARCLVMSGAQEATIVNSTLGLDTVDRSTTNATLEFASAASRNQFIGCDFIMSADNVGPNHVLLTGTSAIDRWISFEDCSWYSFWANDADKVTHAFDLAAQTATGHVLMKGRQLLVGFDDWEASDSGNMYFEPYTATANAVGIGINPSVS